MLTVLNNAVQAKHVKRSTNKTLVLLLLYTPLCKSCCNVALVLVVAAQEDVCVSIVVVFNDRNRSIGAKFYVFEFLGGVSFPFCAHEADGRGVGEDGKAFFLVFFNQSVDLAVNARAELERALTALGVRATAIGAPSGIAFAEHFHQFIIRTTFPLSCKNLAELAVGYDGEIMHLTRRLCRLHRAREVAGINSFDGIVFQEFCRVFGLLVPKLGQGSIGVPRKNALQICHALSVANKNNRGQLRAPSFVFFLFCSQSATKQISGKTVAKQNAARRS